MKLQWFVMELVFPRVLYLGEGIQRHVKGNQRLKSPSLSVCLLGHKRILKGLVLVEMEVKLCLSGH